MTRYNPNINEGLSNEQVELRIKEGLVHHDVTVPTKSIKEIIFTNVFTAFNFLNFGLAFCILLAGNIKNLLFIGTVFLNMFISIFQEIKAKRIIDKLSLLDQTKVTVIREKEIKEITKEEIVLDDLIILKTGNQVVVDSYIQEGELLVNESFITGEDIPIEKKPGDMILSGSFIVSGNSTIKVEHIGEDNYTSKISKDAKYLKKLNSELMNSLNRVIKSISVIIVPVGLLLLFNQMNIPNTPFNIAVINTCAALIGMIPDGLILLTSTVLAVSVIRLARVNVLVQELYCIETLARVDVLCLDKTGTITEGYMEVVDYILEDGVDDAEFARIIDSYTNTMIDYSPTMKAIETRFKTEQGKAFTAKKIVPFSSERKYSSIELSDCTYYLGAYDFILDKHNKKYDEYSKDYRVILLAKEEKGSNKRIPMGIILVQDKIRESAKKTIEYFKEQGVTVKVISGDNPVTVSHIAKRVGIDGYDKYVDLSNIETKEELKEAYLNNTIFGRVKPNQKKQLILLIKELGHTVAMTGDGVNDVLALKEADCSIAMASGTEATRNVSQLVLMDSNFDSLPHVVAEGRRTVNNISRSASLFLTKTMYTMLTVITLLLIAKNYPFQPIHLSLMNLITIGVPSFVLALEPNKERIKGSFLSMVIATALPISLTIYTIVLLSIVLGPRMMFGQEQISTVCVLLTTLIMLVYQFKLCRPFNTIRRVMFITLCTLFSIEILFFRDFFSLSRITGDLVFFTAILFILGMLLWYFYDKFIKYFVKSYKSMKSKKEKKI